MTEILLIVAGLIALVVGAELLVRGASRLATACGISSLIVGLTVVAFGTSAPEFAVSAASAIKGQPEIVLGNVVGSNIMNVLLILGLSAMVVPLTVHQKLVWFDVPLMIFVSVLFWGICFDRLISRLEGGIFFGGLLAFTAWSIYVGRRESSAEVQQEYDEAFHAERGTESGSFDGSRKSLYLLRQLGFFVAGLVLLVLGAGWLVSGASELARRFGVSELLIGLTIVAGGTSLPELATSIVAACRGERDIAVGNVVGSNLFNLLGVIGLSGVIAPAGIPVAEQAMQFDIPVMVAVAVACLPVFFSGHRIARWEGAMFFGYFVAYSLVLYLIATRHDSFKLVQIVMTGFVIPITVITLTLIAVREFKSRRHHENQPD